MEEVMLQGMLIGGSDADVEEKLKLSEDFIPKIDCWSVCDTFCGGLKIATTHPERVWDFIQPYLNSDKEYEIRFGVVMLLYYLKPEYVPLAFAHFDRIKHEAYYVKMAVAWTLSMYYVNLPELTMEYLKDNKLDTFTYNKTLQKIVESLRVDPETKAIIKCMKRK
jgi:3-methyladenine DNA glycosylase AlkD